MNAGCILECMKKATSVGMLAQMAYDLHKKSVPPSSQLFSTRLDEFQQCFDRCTQAGWTVTTTGSLRVELISKKLADVALPDQYFAATYGTSSSPVDIRYCELGQVTLAYGSSRFCGFAGNSLVDNFGGTLLLLVHMQVLVHAV